MKKYYDKAKEYAGKAKDYAYKGYAWAKANPKKAMFAAALGAAFYFGAKLF